MKINIIRIILVIMLLGTFYIIFGFSSQNSTESSGLSLKVSRGIIEIMNKDLSEELKTQEVEKIEPVIRKVAHFSIYSVVGFLIMALASTYKINFWKKMIISLTSGFLYACSDEFHQTFVSGRSGKITDVLIDTSGVFLGIIICVGILKIWKLYVIRKNALNEQI